jgi:hypothetical protein
VAAGFVLCDPGSTFEYEHSVVLVGVARLYISPQTAATHLKRIYARLGVGSPAALVRYVVEAGRPEKYPEPGTDARAPGRHRPGS